MIYSLYPSLQILSQQSEELVGSLTLYLLTLEVHFGVLPLKTSPLLPITQTSLATLFVFKILETKIYFPVSLSPILYFYFQLLYSSQ